MLHANYALWATIQPQQAQNMYGLCLTINLSHVSAFDTYLSPIDNSITTMRQLLLWQ